ncbi:hypothetical protein [Desulfobacter curvatus]|uniref:hypothetical protein n=1 Tax=Desulfobacter curvatus TaxID=2290 RepID=UPI0003768683|nr:hypothetical protein [Desulfobacter curvatus]
MKNEKRTFSKSEIQVVYLLFISMVRAASSMVYMVNCGAIGYLFCPLISNCYAIKPYVHKKLSGPGMSGHAGPLVWFLLIIT